MRHAAVMVDIEGTHRVIPLDEDVCCKNYLLFDTNDIKSRKLTL